MAQNMRFLTCSAVIIPSLDTFRLAKSRSATRAAESPSRTSSQLLSADSKACKKTHAFFSGFPMFVLAYLGTMINQAPKYIIQRVKLEQRK